MRSLAAVPVTVCLGSGVMSRVWVGVPRVTAFVSGLVRRVRAMFRWSTVLSVFVVFGILFFMAMMSWLSLSRVNMSLYVLRLEMFVRIMGVGLQAMLNGALGLLVIFLGV